ncbi:MAG: serine/threonine protein phosphatase, partial [Cohaesibacter sp.]|nr:serine/threonine protein phosphatase [Cohaesibacter sp.]
FNFGGKETLASYGLDLDYILRMKLHKDEFIALVRQTIPPEHIAFLEALPIALSTPYAHFAHAGMRPGRDMEKQTDEDLMWIRGDFLIDKAASDRLIVHGHTPSNKPLIGPDRIGIDTGAYMGGGLTAIRFVAKDYSFLSVR